MTCVFLLQRWLSGSDVVLVCEPAKDRVSADAVPGEVDPRWRCVSLSGCELAQGAVRPGCVVVPQGFGQHLAQVALIDNQQPVEQLPAQGPYHPFADGVCSGRLWRTGENPDGLCREHGIEGSPGTLRALKTLSPRCGCGPKACCAWRRPLSC